MSPRRIRIFALAFLVVAGICAWSNLPRPIQIIRWAAAAPHVEFELTDPDAAQPAKPFTPKYNTLAHRALDLEADESPVCPAKYRLLDDLIDSAKQRITYDPTLRGKAERRQAIRILKTIDRVLTDHNVLYPPGDYDVQSVRLALSPQHYDRAMLDRILRVGINARRREHAQANPTAGFHIMDCDMTSIMSVSIAQGLGIDRLHLVDLPDHMFVRWELHEGSHISWDTNDASVVEDREVAEDYDLGKRIRAHRVYLASMTDREAMGFLHFLRAGRYEERDQDAKAIADFEKALELYPQATQIKSDLAWRYATSPGISPEKRARALTLAKAALDLEKDCADFWASLAAAEAANGHFDKAIDHMTKARDLADTLIDRGDFTRYLKQLRRGEVPKD